MKHIFISRDSLINGRGRFRRRLEAQLDKQGKKDGRSLLAEHLESRSIAGEEHLQQYMPVIVDTHPAHTLGESAKDNSTLSFIPQEPLLFCSYLEFCDRACFQDTDKYNLCQIRKFKNKWGDDYGKFRNI